ncbi:MAG TPA: aldo/keto reductase [Aminivibrio sp.]|uniref:aldo/keto reductase n=1 Tax=Aminivibrio sp. TaxID=1872489 RepID=UPI002C1E494C|nr:aldo/keto reductase [Aminivibrio sp.]HPF86327.1 aldo/keto reductase [Aminivibrio sp.]
MLYRSMPRTGDELSILGFGCMRLPLDGEGKIDEHRAASMIRSAIDRGVNYIDTAYPYHGGESEPIVGRALGGGYREKVFLATKLPSWMVETPSDMDRFLDEQLARLQTDVIDYYLLHSLNAERWEIMKKNGFGAFLDRALADGRIRRAGFSFHDQLPLFREIVDAYPWHFCQIQYNYLDTNYQAGTAGLKYASERNMGVVIMEPLRGGNLARNVPDVMKKIWSESPKPFSPAGWALRWLWDQPEVSVVLSGMTTEQDLEDNLASADDACTGCLTAGERDMIARVTEEYRTRMKVLCTGCQYCMPCPAGVNIPECFNRYNMAFMFDNLEQARMTYPVFLKPGARASACVKCGACEEKCPQNLQIRALLDSVTELLEPKE